MSLRPLTAAFAACALALCASGTRAQSVADANLVITNAASGLNAPTQIRFLGRNDFFVTEKNTGRVVRVQNGTQTTALDLNVSNESERGLLGITLAPDFATSRSVFVYYSATNGADGGAWTENRLSRFTWDGTSLTGEQLIRTLSSSSDNQANGPNHDGGPILFGPDGKLYGVTGDLNRNGAEQNNQGAGGASSLVGGIYRLNPDGSIPSDNPFASNANPAFQKWYAYGVRNSFGLAVDPVTGSLWDTENGPDRYDEINLVAPGFNSGWSQIMGPDSRDPQGVSDLVNLPGSAYSDPEFSFFSPVGITGLDFLADSGWGASYRDGVLVGDNNTGSLYLLRLNAARDGFVLGSGLDDLVADNLTERNSLRFGQDFGAVTDIQVGPDGAVYVVGIGEGRIYRLAAVPGPGALITTLLGATPGVLLLLRRHRNTVRRA